MKLTSLALLAGLTAVSAVPVSNVSEYEYVIIGSRPGGANLARSGHSVFLIEVGGDHGDDILKTVPVMGGTAAEHPEISWAFFVTHYQNQTQARRDNRLTNRFAYLLPNGTYYVGLDPPEDTEPVGLLYPRGNTLGGSAQVNAADAIADSTGDQSWRGEKMRNVFIELENFTYLPVESPGHGFDGLISSNRNNLSYATDLMRRDPNRVDPDRYKSSLSQMATSKDASGRRSAARNYIIETVNARNPDGSRKYPLTVSLHSLATRILLESRVSGSKPKKGVPGTVKATREVIVSGRVFNTPQILKLSGIGPRDELDALGIHIYVDLPAVGSYLFDNYEGGISIEAASDLAVVSPCTFTFDEEDLCYQEWLISGTGPYAEAGGPYQMLYRSSVSETENADTNAFGGTGFIFRGTWTGYSAVTYPATAFFWSVVTMQTRNRAGTVTLRSTDPREPPKIDFNWFLEGGDEDLTAIREAIELSMGILNMTGKPYAPLTPLETLRDSVYSHHAQDSCRMGPAGNTSYCVP
ncbi:GMC oxidoreductase [Xylaria sp. FL1042]|nr:GMC oxidoreductase [Xylaria sp. FL1042]